MNFRRSFLLVLLAGFLSVCLAQITDKICYAKKDIIIVMDASSSVDQEEWINMKKFVADLVGKLQVAETKIRFDVFAFNNKVQKESEIKFTGYRNIKHLQEKIRSMTGRSNGTRVGNALKYINDDVLDRTRSSTENEKIEVVVWLITDGKNHDENVLEKQSQKLRNKARIQVLGITNKEDKVEKFFDERLRPHVDNITMIKNMHEDFTDNLLVQVAKELCKKKIPNIPDEKDKCRAIKKDIIIVLDSSESMKPKEWTEMKTFVSDLVGRFKIKDNAVQFEIFRFDNGVASNDEISFGSYSSVEELQDGIIKMKREGLGGSNTNLGAAIRHINRDVMKRGRSGVEKQVLILTDGKSDDVIVPELKLLKKTAQIDVLAILRPTRWKKSTYWEKLEKNVDNFYELKNSKEWFTGKILESTAGILCD